MARRMVRIRRTVTVVSEMPVDNYSTGHKRESDVRQMTDDEIRNFEMRLPDKGLGDTDVITPEDQKLALGLALIEEMEMQELGNQDFGVVVEFYEADDKED